MFRFLSRSDKNWPVHLEDGNELQKDLGNRGVALSELQKKC